MGKAARHRWAAGMATAAASTAAPAANQPPHRLTPFSAQPIQLSSSLRRQARAPSGLMPGAGWPPGLPPTMPWLPGFPTSPEAAPEAASLIQAHKLVNVPLNSEEGARVVQLLEGSGFSAVRLQRNQNATLQAAYEECLASMSRGPASLAGDPETRQALRRVRRARGLPPTPPPFDTHEALLFHKTRAAYSTILETGLSNCYGGQQGVFGKGIYFADDLRKSAQYGGPNQQVLICRVALGDCVAVPNHRGGALATGDAIAGWDRIAAPRKHDCHKRYAGDTFFNSWFGQSDHNEFIVSKDVQVYPLYLLEYSRHTSSNEQQGMAVPDFVIGYNGANRRVLPGQWGRMLDGLMDEIRLMEECQALNRELWTETVDLTGPETGAAAGVSSSGVGRGTEEVVIVLDDEESRPTRGSNKRQRQDVATTTPAAASFTVDLTQASQEEVVVEDETQAAAEQVVVEDELEGAGEEVTDDDDAVIVLCDSPVREEGVAGAQRGSTHIVRGSSSATTLPLRRSSVTPAIAASIPACSICMEDWRTGDTMVALPCCGNARFHDTSACFGPLLRTGVTMSGRAVRGVKCPFCATQHGEVVGTCPDGSLVVNCDASWITLMFSFSGGLAPDGQRFSGRHQVAYLPNNREGQAVLPLVRRAFDFRHCFRLGVSDTTGLFGICWASLHFKTSRTGGAQYHGFPDATYLERLMDELKAVLGSAVIDP